MFAIALAVGLTPESLLMLVTITLARSVMKMARRKVIEQNVRATSIAISVLGISAQTSIRMG